MVWLFVSFSFLLTLSGAALIAWHLWKDRDYWRVQYEKERAGREHLFQQGILRAGGRTPEQPLHHVTRPMVERPSISDEERAYCENVIGEAATLKIITHTEGTRLLSELNVGRLNRKGLDDIVAKWRQPQFEGSILEI